MKKTYEITYGNSIKINRGNYEQESPLYSIKTIIVLKNGETINEKIEFDRLRKIVDPLLDDHWFHAKINLSNLRIRVKDGKQYLSVTSILHPDPLPIDPAYALRGLEIDRLCSHFIEKGVWLAPEKTIDPLKFSDIKYQEFFVKYAKELDFKSSVLHGEIFNTKYSYSGEFDLICKVKGVKTLCDFKTGKWTWTQLVAYKRCDEMKDVKNIAIFDLKNCELVILDEEWLPYWEEFLVKRGECKQRFGI